MIRTTRTKSLGEWPGRWSEAMGAVGFWVDGSELPDRADEIDGGRFELLVCPEVPDEPDDDGPFGCDCDNADFRFEIKKERAQIQAAGTAEAERAATQRQNSEETSRSSTNINTWSIITNS